MNEIINNWYLYLALISGLTVGGVFLAKWLKLPRPEQINNLKQWLLLAVIEAEKELGGETGILKLRKVYDKAISQFTWLKIIPFSMFENWVDEALVEMKKLLATNKKVKLMVEEKK